MHGKGFCAMVFLVEGLGCKKRWFWWWNSKGMKWRWMGVIYPHLSEKIRQPSSHFLPHSPPSSHRVLSPHLLPHRLSSSSILSLKIKPPSWRWWSLEEFKRILEPPSHSTRGKREEASFGLGVEVKWEKKGGAWAWKAQERRKEEDPRQVPSPQPLSPLDSCGCPHACWFWWGNFVGPLGGESWNP